ncbi:MAG: hypothetical protein B6229_01595 [Spirochaetaceae bacterium 4572_7]|nr:MAG: hypothetical protein B6229_01595 [Spirochaetaceae bacterium 4572_7]
MKYELETIPVWDAFKADCECPICKLKEKAEETYLKFFLGNSVMVPETPLKDKKLIEECNSLKELIESKDSECMICDRINNTMKRYIFTTVYLWKKNPEFKEFFMKSKGFCLPHTTLITDMASEILSGVELGEFVQDIIELEKKNLIRLEEEILYFTQKFSQENDDKPWNGTKDAHYRTIQKLTGKVTDH